MLAVLLALLTVQPARPFAQERLLLDRRLEALRRILPDGPTAAADALLVRQQAEAAQLAKVQVQARPPVESGARGEVVLDLGALAGYEQVDRFFQKLALSHRLVDVESLTLTATSEQVLQLAAVVRLPYWPQRAPLPAPPESAKGRPAGVPRPALAAFLRDQALAFAKSERIAERRRTRRNPRLFLSELASVTRDRPVVLGYAALGEGFTIRGLALGEGPLRAFENRIESGYFRVADFLMAKQGACHRFEAHGQCPVAGPEAELAVPVEDPFDQSLVACRSDRDASRAIVAKGRAPNPKQPARGPLTLRLRDVDLADVFGALSVLGFGGYVVDEPVGGRTSVELAGATLEEALAVVRKAAGVELNEVGPLRRVSLARAPARRGVPAGGPPASFALKRCDVRDLLAAMAEVEPGLASLGPPGFLGKISVWTKDAPLIALRSAVLDSVGLAERIEDDRRILERATGSGEPATPVASSEPEPRLALRREELTVHEFELAGVGGAGDRYLAFAYSPTGQLFAYAPGDRLSDAVVRSVDASDVVLDTEEGPLRLSVAPLER